jgi:hypothetical protein
MKRKRSNRSVPMIVDPAYAESDEARENVSAVLTYGESFEDYFPSTPIGPEGTWIMVTKPPICEFTVPPLSMWYATPWPMETGDRAGISIKRLRIQTPMGDLGIFPHECSVVKDISFYLGQEENGMRRSTCGVAASPSGKPR